MPDALWALAACLLIEAFLAPVARIVRMCRYRYLIQPPKVEDSLGSIDEQGRGAEGRGGCLGCSRHPDAKPGDRHNAKCLKCGREVYLATFFVSDRS